MSTRCKLSTISLLAIILLSTFLFGLHSAFAQTDQVDSKLQAANECVNQAFNAVLDAEKAGANVTNLLAQLNTAEGILALAENSFRTGDFSTATAQADSVLPIAQEVTTAAQEAKQTASVSEQNAFWSTIVFTVIGAFVFVLALILVWRRFKRNYIKSLSDAKPEVNSQ